MKDKEGVDFVFEQNPELAGIGNKKQYSEYLKTIFPESKIKNIVYHSPGPKFKGFEKRKGDKGSREKRIFFTPNFEFAKSWLLDKNNKIIPAILNSEKLFDYESLKKDEIVEIKNLEYINLVERGFEKSFAEKSADNLIENIKFGDWTFFSHYCPEISF